MDQLLYKVTTVMAKLEICRATVYRMVHRGDLDLVKVGVGATRITAASVERVVAAVKPAK